mmetsp:Transcript_115460/g.203935  ORF Transcript_115460/g.203935 Transcript_115460/m.203935 type:complete len:213 (-) Transcript_115460:14-652(-)
MSKERPPLPLLLALALLPAAWWFSSQEPDSESEVDEPLELGIPKFTLKELRRYDGRPGHEAGDGDGLLIAVWGRVFNVSMAPEFYAPGAGYDVFPGHDCTRAFALTSTKKKHLDRNLDDLKEAKVTHLNETYWLTYVQKYPIVGVLVDAPYDPAAYDRFAGPFDQVRTTAMAAVGNGSSQPRKRQSKCPVTRAFRAARDVVVELLPRQLLSG